MKPAQYRSISLDYLANVDSDIKHRLANSEVYQRFIHERDRLEKLVDNEYKRTGKLTNDEIIKQNRTVEALGINVLDEIRDINFLLHEPSREDFQILRNELSK